MKRIISLAFAAALICCMSFTVWAHDVPDLTTHGSISISMHSGSTQVGGGTLTIYRVCEVVENNGDYSFSPVGGFVDSGESFADLNSSDLAKRLANYADYNDIAGEVKEIDENGNVSFADLELGLYLLVQETAAEGYNIATPFLVTVPRLLDGVYIYDVEASPKVQLTPVTPPDPPDSPDPPDLPQTGVLNWPVPLMTVSGLGLFAAGWKLRSDNKETKKEKDEK